NGGTYDRSDCSGTASLSGSTISLNKAELGAGIYHYYGSMDLENSTISGNKATLLGGGIFSDWTMTVTNVTMTKNTAIFGGGIYNADDGTITLNRTLISGNKAAAGFSSEVYNYNGTVVADNINLFGQKNDPGVANVSPGPTDVIPGSTVPTSKILSPSLKDNGGPTPTHALVAGSPALDQIAAGAPATDQRGVTRPQNGLSDIGAFELEVGP
ncbi:MAG: choice-of-anchor Q domain-containing protein, partial [Candidatus Rokuibacteriota bacterium]